MRRLPSIAPSPCLLHEASMLRRLAVCHPPIWVDMCSLAIQRTRGRDGCVSDRGDMAQGDFNRRAQQFMNGRRGPDDLANLCVWVAVILAIVDLFMHTGWLSWVSMALVVYAVWRMCSKNVYARMSENDAFLTSMGPVRPWLQNPGRAANELRTYKHVKCPSCGQKVRVPRGKGKLRVTCPKCHEKFEVKS